MEQVKHFFHKEQQGKGQVKNFAHWGVGESGLRDIHGQEVIPGSKSKLDGTGVKVALLDSAVDLSHPGFRKDVSHRGYDFITDGTIRPVSTKDMWHGTMVAGILAADGRGDDMKMHGVSPGVQLYCYRVVRRGRIQPYALEKSLVCAMEHEVDIINISLQNFPHKGRLYRLLQEAHKMGIVILAQAGNGLNHLEDNIEFPAAYQETLAVGGHARNDSRSTNARGQLLDFTAPGDKVYSLAPGHGYGFSSGSSFASPFVAGLAALVIQIWKERFHEKLLPSSLKSIMKKCTHTQAFHPAYGYGKILPSRLISYVRACGKETPPDPCEIRYQLNT